MPSKLFISRNPIISALTKLRIISIRLRRRFFKTKGFHAALMPPAAPNSLGDDAMVKATVTSLTELGYETVTCVSFAENDGWQKIVAKFASTAGYSELKGFRRSKAIIKLIKQLSHIDDCILLGADILDGGYGDWHVETKLDALRLLQEIGVRVHIIGFSYKENASPSSIKMFQDLGPDKSICLRDKKSHQRFFKFTQIGAKQGADIAFLYPHGDEKELPDSWFSKQRENGHTVLGYNVNVLLAKKHSRSRKGYLEDHTTLVGLILQENPKLSICLLPHDSRQYSDDITDSDLAISEELGDLLRAAHGDRVLSLKIPNTAGEVASIVSNWDCAVVGRMHLGIACLRSSVPAMFWEYQDKVSGLLADHFDFPEGILLLKQLESPHNISGHINGIIQKHEEYQKRISSKLPQVRTLSQENLSDLKILDNVTS